MLPSLDGSARQRNEAKQFSGFDMHINTDTYAFRSRVLVHLLEASGASVVLAVASSVETCA